MDDADKIANETPEEELTPDLLRVDALNNNYDPENPTEGWTNSKGDPIVIPEGWTVEVPEELAGQTNLTLAANLEDRTFEAVLPETQINAIVVEEPIPASTDSPIDSPAPDCPLSGLAGQPTWKLTDDGFCFAYV